MAATCLIERAFLKGWGLSPPLSASSIEINQVARNRRSASDSYQRPNKPHCSKTEVVSVGLRCHFQLYRFLANLPDPFTTSVPGLPKCNVYVNAAPSLIPPP